ncbi:hypothetical protein HAX54_017992, partial [Datura stramonium]|nr:hypothetical protein [Datura stramonium]
DLLENWRFSEALSRLENEVFLDFLSLLNKILRLSSKFLPLVMDSKQVNIVDTRTASL